MISKIDIIKDEHPHIIMAFDKISDFCDKMCNIFFISIIWDIIDVYNECLHSVTKDINIRVKNRKCFCNMKRKLGAKGLFYFNQNAISMLYYKERLSK